MEADEREERWLKVLAGKHEGEVTDADREALSLRQAVLSAREPEVAGRELDDSLARLMFRLRRERLLGYERPRLYWAAAAVAATVVLGVSLSLMRPETEVPQREESVSRGVSWPQELTDADPPALAVKLVDDLKALGISATRSAEGPTVIVKARIPNREDPVLAALLARYRLKAPPDGTLDVRIRPAPR